MRDPDNKCAALNGDGCSTRRFPNIRYGHLIGGSGSGGSQARDADGAATRSGRAGTVPPGKASQSTLLQMANRAGASKKELESVQGAKEA